PVHLLQRESTRGKHSRARGIFPGEIGSIQERDPLDDEQDTCREATSLQDRTVNRRCRLWSSACDRSSSSRPSTSSAFHGKRRKGTVPPRFLLSLLRSVSDGVQQVASPGFPASREPSTEPRSGRWPWDRRRQQAS